MVRRLWVPWWETPIAFEVTVRIVEPLWLAGYAEKGQNLLIKAPLSIGFVSKVQWRYEWVWVWGFVHPASGQTYWWLLPRVNIQLFNQVLADFAQHFSNCQNKHVILTEDPRRLAHRSGYRALLN
ncbi:MULTISPECIES: hypothetical protein [unclassified Moorena]|uniref:hypothetical protein n=1 Tax=unclassified Moorena TaxID=2683338 RepID=UPI00140193A4|nr:MULTISPECIES: hypothetical protein [unclassified Moorena]NEO17205.1 hypothetical protein [Moorena sp. SIO3E8]NEQ03749.1 hypothetical protein [Moorena sp. SIO3F7]